MPVKHHIHRRAGHNHDEHAKEVRDFWDDINPLNIIDNGIQDRGRTSTVYVYYTAPATFDGATGGFVTASDTPEPTSTPDATTTPAASSTPTSILVETSSKPSKTHKTTSTTGQPTAILPGSSTVPTTLGIIVASATSASKTLTNSTPSASSSAAPTEGMTAGGKAGLAIGILLGLGAVISLVFFCFRQRKKAAERERLEDEKSFGSNAAMVGGAARSASTKTTATAPRLSLRPVTQFLPNLGANQQQTGNEIPMSQTAGAGSLAPKSAWERPSTSASQDATNPFGNHAAVDAHNAAGAPVIATGPGGAYSSNAAQAAGAGLAAGAAAGAAMGLARGASKRENRPQQLDFTRDPKAGLGPPSPTGTDFSVSSATPGTNVQTGGAAAIAAAGGPQNSAVHRVQLDFKPSMDDELELKAGQLIRLLHEYDDGWALCIRLDRSQQGVVPRTCLSTRPVKPRPQGPPGPGQRGPPPPGGFRGPPQGPPRPGSANSNRGPGPQYNRPGSANGNRGQGPMYNPNSRSNSPAMQGQMRPASPSAMRSQAPNEKSSSPPRQGHRVQQSIDRKPVPGMAL